MLGNLSTAPTTLKRDAKTSMKNMRPKRPLLVLLLKLAPDRSGNVQDLFGSLPFLRGLHSSTGWSQGHFWFWSICSADNFFSEANTVYVGLAKN